MSLYADEDVELYPAEVPAVPSDPQRALSAALIVNDPIAQAEALLAASSRFEEHPEQLHDAIRHLLPIVALGPDTVLRAWTIDLIALTVGRSALQGNIKLEVALEALDALNKLLNMRSAQTVRAVIPIFSTIYPMLFRYFATASSATDPNAPQLYNLFTASKTRILSFILNPAAVLPNNVGVQAAAWKFVQKVLLAGTRVGGDPRLQARSNEANVASIPFNSLLDAADIEKEAHDLRDKLVTDLYLLDDPALLHPIINTIPALVKARMSLGHLLVAALASWTPENMKARQRPPMQIRAVEKTLRAAMGHIIKQPALVGFSGQLQAALADQKQRMERAWVDDTEARRARRARIQSGAGKHVLEDAESSGAGGSAAKRRRLEVLPGSGDGRGGVIVDVSQFAVEPVVDVVMAGLSAVSDQLLKQAFDNARTAILENAPDAVRVLAPSLFTEQPKEEEAIVNPLDMELDDDELLMEPLEQDEGDETVLIADFTLPPPEPIPAGEKDGIVDVAVRRIWDGGADLAHLADLRISDAPRSAVQPKEIWMLLLARLSSRGGEDKRRLIGEFVAKDFGSRSKFATVWLNEEWLARRRGKPNQYEEGVMAVLGAYIPSLDAKDNSLKNFLVGLPEIPSQAIEALKPLCEDPDRRLVGFFSLRDLAEARPPVRQQAVATLLEFCTHPDRKIRLVAITTVRRWVPDTPMSSSLIAYALGCLRLLVARAKDIKEVKVVKEDGDEDEAKEGEAKEGEAKAEDKPETAEPEAAVVPSTLSDDDTIPDGEVVQSKYLGEVTPESVFQYVELAFALSRRDQDLLDDIFAMYAKLPASIQPVIADMFNGLVRSLGASKKLLDIVHSLPAGGDKLVLGAITVLVNEGAGDGVVEVVRELMKEREDLDPHFVIAVIDKLGKAEIESQMPAIASLLLPAPGRDVAAETEVVKKAIGFIVPRVKPADFLVFLYQETAGVEATSAIFDVCLSMPSAFPPQELEAAMKRALDGPGKIPLCFIRTVFRAILSTPQKDDKNTAAGAAGAGDKKASKLGFVHEYIKGHIISRLIAKRVWEVPALWAGFPALVQMAGRGAFSALLQMPVEQIREMTERRPKLKTMLATWLADKPTPRSQLSFLFAKDEKDKDKEVSGAGQRGEAPATVAAA